MYRGKFINIAHLRATYPHGCLAGDWAIVGSIRYVWTRDGGDPETELRALIEGKADLRHTHSRADITDLQPIPNRTLNQILV